MKRETFSVAAFLAALAFCAVAMRADPTPAPAPTTSEVADAAGWTYSVTPEFVSQFMYRGQLLDGFSFQPTEEADYGNFAIGVWSNFPISDVRTSAQPGPENDLFGSYTYSIVTDVLDLQPGFLLYTYQFTGPGLFRDTFEPSLALDWTVKGFTITPKLYYDVVMRGPTEELSVAYTVPLTQLKTELDLLATVGTYLYDDYARGQRAWGNYWLVGVTAPFQLTKANKLSVGFAYNEGTDGYTRQGNQPKVINPISVGRGVVTLSDAISF